MARARDIKGENNNVIAVIGDGALTGGMALEALNDLGSSGTDMLVVLNDNEMSISKNVGGISMMLSKLRTKSTYIKANLKGKKTIRKIPFIGEKIIKFVQRGKRGIKQLVIPKMYFEDIGFRYLGPVDGHNLEELEDILTICKHQEGPILVHVLTKKGKGYKPAEEVPDKFHSTSSLDKKTGEKLLQKGVKNYSKVFGDKLVELARQNSKIVAITAAMRDGTGLTEFAKKYPKRFFDVGIAEQHAIGMAAGLSKAGMIPVVPIYSSFLQRAYDQMVHDVAIQNLPVVICADRAGIVGNDGETHQGLLDMTFTNTIPNFTIMAPKDFLELEEMLSFSVNLQKPVLLRYPKGGEAFSFDFCSKIEFGKAEVLVKGKDVTIIAIGKMVARAMEVCKKLEMEDIHCTVVNARFLKPFDEATVCNNLSNVVVTIEDGSLINGLGATVERIIRKSRKNIYLQKIAYPDEFIKHGSIKEIEKKYGLDVCSITQKIEEVLENQFLLKNRRIR